MSLTWCAMLLLSLSAAADAGAYFRNSGQFALPFSHPLTILPERPFAAADSLLPTPLYVVPGAFLRVLDHRSAADFSGATPGVRVVLERPMVLSAPTTTIPFPSAFTVDHERGVLSPMSVAAVIAPVPSSLSLRYPITVRIVYAVAAVEAAPHHLPPSYLLPQYYYNYPRYSFQTALAVPQAPAPPLSTPSTQRPETAVTSERPDEEGVEQEAPLPVGSPQLVTVLDFPSAVAEPGSLFFQPPLTGEELGNREPPQAIVPAGIVQSAAPIPNLSVFVNSKESQYLQVLREEALRAKTPTSYVFRGDSVLVDAL